MSTWLQLLGVFTGVACVLLGIAQIAWSWPVGIAYNIVLFIVYWKSGVYAMAGLQILYMGVAFYGWWNWLRGGTGHTQLKVSNTPPALMALLTTAAAVLAVALHWVLAHYTKSNVPWLDAITTSMALVAQYLLSRKMMATWGVFIVMDVIAIVINYQKELYALIALYLFFIGLCVAGYRQWKGSMEAARAES